MVYLTLILILLPSIKALFCPNFYDYTSGSVTCNNQCPQGSRTINNKCLSSNQYLIGQQVHHCQRGWVDSQNSICCPSSNFIAVYNGASYCAKCNTRPYANGRICCPGSHYADFTNSSSIKCTPLGTGICNSITMKNLFQVCCVSGQFYNLEEQRCINPAGYNCHFQQKVCCNVGRRLESVGGRLFCVSNCNWSQKDSFYCKKKYCNSEKQFLSASPILKNQTLLPIAYSTSCCYGMGSNGQCLQQTSFCYKQFYNRGWSICCQSGQFYNVRNSQCNSVCEGIILFQFFCIQGGNILNFQNLNSPPSQLPSGSLCNNKLTSPLYPVCCPLGFYINSTRGCQICDGRIINLPSNQICCKFNEIFNVIMKRCQQCKGNINRQGTLCCLHSQYFSYGINGNSRCVDECSDQKIYRTDYCCDSLVSSQCQITQYVPTLCSRSYFLSGSCQACPKFCNLQGEAANDCTISNSFDQCRLNCQRDSIYSSQLSQCLSCDTSCISCIQPFSSQHCTQCKVGYILSQGSCNRCASDCKTCGPSPTICLSCHSNSNRPVLSNGKCINQCQSSKYFEVSNSMCTLCSPSCLECSGRSQFECIKCSQLMFLRSTSCQQCSQNCRLCHQNSLQCYQCRQGSVLTENFECTGACQSGEIPVYSPSLNHQICKKCHPTCLTCQTYPQNCVICANNQAYLSDQFGINLCYPCVYPCLLCDSATICKQCDNGFFLQVGRCTRCNPTCQTCMSISQNGCLSCFGDSQLIQGRCVGCSGSCQQCDTNQNCLICKSGFFLLKGSCTNSCPQSTFILNNLCSDCLTNCSSCSNSSRCLTCSLSHPISFQGLCLNNCPQGYEIKGGSCSEIKIIENNTIPNNNSNNDSNGNNNNNDDYYNDNTNKNNRTNTTIKTLPTIKNQLIFVNNTEKMLYVISYLNFPDPTVILHFYLYSTTNNSKTLLKSNKQAKFSSNGRLQSINSNDQIINSVYLPESGQGMKNSILLTSINGGNKSTAFFNSRSIWDFIFYDYVNNPLKGLQYVGFAFGILITIYSIFSKIKGHFIAEQSNTLILHMINFIQTVYLFKFTRLHEQGMYHFLNGFSFMHFLWFPNFFYGSIPKNYIEYPAQKSLIPDCNFIKTSGSSISLLLIYFILTLIASIVSYLIYKNKKLYEMPQIRKICRIGILGMHITFYNILFCAVTQFIQPKITTSSQFEASTKTASIIMFILVLVSMILIIFHFYKTYNSDVLEHYYTLREAFHYLLIVSQSFIFAFSIGKPLNCLFLILLEIIWFIANYMLYKYGESDSLKDHIKFLISTISIIIAYLFLSLAEQINWIVITVFVSIIVVVLIIYSSYQIVGLYYTLFKKQEVKSRQRNDRQKSKVKLEKEKQSVMKI